MIDSNEDESSQETVESVADIASSWNYWYRRLFISYSLLYATNAFFETGIVFCAPRLDFWCKTENNVNNESTFRICEKHVDNTTLISCTEWIYDLNGFWSTLVDEFNLVCNRSWMISASTSVYQLGYAISALATGYLSDRWGRLYTLKLCVFCEILAGYSGTFALSAEHFLVSRLFLGFFAYGKYLSGYVLLMEMTSSSNRVQVSILSDFGYFIGGLALALIAYLLPHFRYLQLCPATFSLLLLWTLWTCAESPRWLIVNGRIKEAELITMKAVSGNSEWSKIDVKCKFMDFAKQVIKEGNMESKSKESLLSLLRMPLLLNYCLALYSLWCICALINYSLIVNVGNLGGNLFLNNFLYTVMETGTIFVAYFILPRVKRRKIYFISMVLASISLFGLSVFIDDNQSTVIKVGFALAGVFFVSFVIHLNYLQATEIFPTTHRQLGIGSCSLAARLGSILAPFSKEFDDMTSPRASAILFGVLAITAACVGLILPETRGKEIPDTVEDASKILRSDEQSPFITKTRMNTK